MFSAEDTDSTSNKNEGLKIEPNPYFASSDFTPQDHSKVFIEWTNKQPVADPKVAVKQSFPSQSNAPFVIQSDAEFHQALARFSEIMDAEANTTEASELVALENAIDTYWDFLYPKEPES